MDIKPLNTDFAVSPQLTIADIPSIAAQVRGMAPTNGWLIL